jgi:hypothetical protein
VHALACRPADHGTLTSRNPAAYLYGGTATAGQFNWGGIHLIINQMGPKVGSVRSEIGRRVQG